MPQSEIPLPGEFLQWLKQLPETHVVRFRNNDWQFWTEDELQETTRVNNTKTTQIGMLAAFVDMYRTAGFSAAKGAAGKPFPYERLEKCCALATDNEDFLIVDPLEQFSVWKFCPDYARCGEVKPVAASLPEFLSGAVVEDALEDDEYSSDY